MKRRTALVVAAPLVAVATMMLGLRVGAGSAVRSASIFAAPVGRPVGAAVPVSLQVLTWLEDRGVRETIAMTGLELVARAGGRTATWRGASNADGIAEANVSLDDLREGDRIEVTLRSGPELLAEGTVPVTRRARPQEGGDVRFSKREGAITLDVRIEGERLVPGFESTVWIHARGAPSRLVVEPEPGLLVPHGPRPACENGWAELGATAQGHVVGMRVDASDDAQHAGVWFGALPVAPGAFFVDLPRAATFPRTIPLHAPNPRTVVYAEIDDEHGRVFAAALPVTTEPGMPTPRALFDVPALAPGLHWLVASGEPRGAETLAGAAIARPFYVPGETTPPTSERACELGPWLARHPAQPLARSLAIDGMSTRGAANRRRHFAGLVLGLGSLATAALLEFLLLTAASREAHDALRASLEEAAMPTPTKRSLVVPLLVALLGFGLLATLLLMKA